MATLQNKTIVIVGGSSGIGFAVALASLQSSAKTVIIASSNEARVHDAVARLKSHNLPGEVHGDVVDATNSEAVKAFAGRIGTVDHIVWTSGDIPPKSGLNEFPFSKVETPDEGQAAFTVRFWGPIVLAKHAKFHPGGSLTLTSGTNGLRPMPGSHLMAGMITGLDGLTRGLAVDLAPVRVNLISPGLIITEIMDKLMGENKDTVLKAYGEKIPLKRVGEPSEIAEAYLFLMKCGYITGQRIDIEGGILLV
ncbi:Short-chain dehydrogenase/reductase phqE [Psilocybe cubensis]|uniref:Uncharacterized protein n=2 Tax=Psilocybe cubensis TaxID=181762 RepID=A0A8H7XNZ1_PSICU|nr:Short-chain dehydrogenase/reductase phqE [Psilocybe cubensis]KAH9475026.1 Short-chain dehydrogenase/reductase phqE [Psilocybe cubensis]